MKNRLLVAACLVLLATTPAHAEGRLWSGSMDLTEEAGAYTIRVNSPNPAGLEVRLAGTSLSIGSGPLDGGARFTQRIDLPLAARDAAPQTSVAANELVVTIPKRPPGQPASPVAPDLAGVTEMARQLLDASGLLGEPGQDSADAIRGKVLDQMDALSRQMDQLADDPAGGGDLLGSMLSRFAPSPIPGAGASFELEELPDRYVLSAAVPREQAKNISVNVDNDRFVTITTRNEAASTAPGVMAAQASSSTQAMTLPGPVQGDRLAMDYKDGKVVISLPKK